MNDDTKYNEFCDLMESKFPKMYKGKRYGGFAVGAGWWHIIESLSAQIYHYVSWKRKNRARDLHRARAGNMDRNDSITPKIEHITVAQIKEKFGGLRFYYDGGDEQISGMVRMAESWADHTCETCGDRGVRRGGGWVRTLCGKHEAEYQQRILERNTGNKTTL